MLSRAFRLHLGQSAVIPKRTGVIFMSLSFSRLMIFLSLCCYTACGSDGVASCVSHSISALHNAQKETCIPLAIWSRLNIFHVFVYIQSRACVCCGFCVKTREFKSKLLVSIRSEPVRDSVSDTTLVYT